MKIMLAMSSFLLALALFAAPALASGPMVLVSGGGMVLDAGGRALADYAYLQPARCYRLQPGARAELSSPDGADTYIAGGPGLICLDSNGVLTLDGREVRPRGKGPEPISAPGKGRAPGPPGAGSLLGKGHPRPDGMSTACRALVVGCDAYGEPDVFAAKMAHALKASEYLRGLGWRVEFLRNPGWEDLRLALNRFALGSKAEAGVFWFSGKGFYRGESGGGRRLNLALADATPSEGRNTPRYAVAFSDIDKMMSFMRGLPLAVVLDVGGTDSALTSSDRERNHHMALVGRGCTTFKGILQETSFPGEPGSILGSLLGGLCPSPRGRKEAVPPAPKPISAAPPQDGQSPQDITAGLFREDTPLRPRGETNLKAALRTVKAWQKAWRDRNPGALQACLSPGAEVGLPIPGVSGAAGLSDLLPPGNGAGAWRRLELSPPELSSDQGAVTVRSLIILLPPHRLWGRKLVETLRLEPDGQGWLINRITAR